GGSVTPSGRVHPGSIPQEAGAPRLVDGDPAVYPVAESPMQEVGELGEAGSGVAGGPATRVLQRLWQLPVVERQPRLDAVAEDLIHQALVEIEPGRVGRAGAVGLYPRPGDREPVRGDAQVGHEPHVIAEPVVVVARRLGGVAPGDRVRHPREGVPDGLAPTPRGQRTLDLVRGGGGPPPEAAGE